MTFQQKRTRIRDIFGIIPITLYTRSFSCKISCIYCPQVSNIPKSYLKNEDTERAFEANYEADLQLDYWIKEIDKKFPGNKPLKLEIIVLGGTFGDLSRSYREDFFKKIYDKLNQKISHTLELAMELNKSAKYRACIITIETRPDTITTAECFFLRKLGVSKIELGIQSIYDDILNFAKRPYSRNEIIEVSSLIRREGFKLGYHIMLNLPLSNLELDRLMLKEITENADLQPDFLKIYPLTLVKNKDSQKKMWQLYDEGHWKPYTQDQLLSLIYDLKIGIPEYIKIQRIQRQFDNEDYIYEDFEIRNVLADILNRKGKECNCLRCQEMKTFKSNIKISSELEYVLNIININNGEYFYFSVKTKSQPKLLLGYLKLNILDRAIIREIKVIGKSSRIGTNGQIQGHGVGEFLLREAENFVMNKGFRDLLINASPGVRKFFEKLGYSEFNNFMKKQFYV